MTHTLKKLERLFQIFPADLSVFYIYMYQSFMVCQSISVMLYHINKVYKIAVQISLCLNTRYNTLFPYIRQGQ